MSSETDSSLPKPNCTITDHHDRLLDDMAEERYASRSEALRAAIEDHMATIDGDNEITFNHLVDQVAQLQDEISELSSLVKEFQSTPRQTVPSGWAADSPAHLDDRESVVHDSGSVDSSVRNDVYDALEELGVATQTEIAGEAELRTLTVRQALEDLIDQGFVTVIDDADSVKYRIPDPTR